MGRILGIDFGKVRIGIAVSDPSKIIAQPIGRLENNKKFPEELKKILQPYSGVEKIVIGLPLQMNGKEGEMAEQVRLFAKKLEEHFPLPIILWDERLTTAQVEKNLQHQELSRKARAGRVDTLAATLILQSYLDSL